jgi:hypothetical protein
LHFQTHAVLLLWKSIWNIRVGLLAVLFLSHLVMATAALCCRGLQQKDCWICAGKNVSCRQQVSYGGLWDCVLKGGNAMCLELNLSYGLKLRKSEVHHCRTWVLFCSMFLAQTGRRNQQSVTGILHHWLFYAHTVSLVLPLSLWMLHVSSSISFHNQGKQKSYCVSLAVYDTVGRLIVQLRNPAKHLLQKSEERSYSRRDNVD